MPIWDILRPIYISFIVNILSFLAELFIFAANE